MQIKHMVRQWQAALLLSAVALAQPAAAMPADQLTVTEYGKSGAWTLRKATADGAVQVCDTFQLTGSEQGVRFEFTRPSSVIAFSGYASAAEEKAMDVEVWFDDARAESQVVSMSLETDAAGFPWRTYRASNDEPDGMLDLFANAKTIHFVYLVKGEGEHEETYPLTGSNGAFHKTIACLDNATPAAAPDAASGEAGAQPGIMHGTCSLTVDGTTYVDIKGSCLIWQANDGTGAFWINTDRENFLGDYFAEIVPDGKGAASGNWNGEKGATHAQSFLGEDFHLQPGGCWTNARARICAMK